MDEYRNELKPQAEVIVKQQLVISAIIDAEKIEATDAEVEERIVEMATSQGRDVPDLKKAIGSKQADYIKNDIIIKKLFELLKKPVKATAKKAPAKAEGEEAKAEAKPVAKKTTSTAKKTTATKTTAKAPAKKTTAKKED